MPYIREECRCGDTIERREYYTLRYHSKGVPRGPNEEVTTEKQFKINSKAAERKLRRKMNANFCGKDYHLVLDYKVRPEAEAMKKNWQKFIRKVTAKAKKQGIIVKYIHVMEVGQKGARHHHVVITGMPVSILRECWTHGRVHINPMDEVRDYGRLAAYFIKYSDRMLRSENRLQGKRWTESRNLIQPVVKKKVLRRAIPHEPKAVKGYYIDEDTVRMGFDSYTGYPFMEYRMVALFDG